MRTINTFGEIIIKFTRIMIGITGIAIGKNPTFRRKNTYKLGGTPVLD